jgi:hypothetical protein
MAVPPLLVKLHDPAMTSLQHGISRFDVSQESLTRHPRDRFGKGRV